MPSLVEELFEGPLDIVGDIHGEIDALRSLLDHLGYDGEGRHPHARRLIFVGDLTDRGPDSPAVVQLVRRLVESERAQCVLGNHDLNLLLGKRKYDNGWFFGDTFQEDGFAVPQVLACDRVRRDVLDFFRTLPLALHRPDLHVVHASWEPTMVDAVRDATCAVEVHDDHYQRIEEARRHAASDGHTMELRHQNENPVKRLTSGPEALAPEPHEIGGKVKHLQRVSWWNEYTGPYCVFGHYSIVDGQPRGNAHSFCVDFGVGKRWTERRACVARGFQLKLAALRWPEGDVMFDEGSSRRIEGT